MFGPASNDRWLLALIAVCGVLAGCEPRDPGTDTAVTSTADEAQPLERRWLGELSLDRVIGGEPPVVLGLPSLLTEGPDGGFALADFGDRTVRAFDAEGRQRWAFGRDGSGPGEFGEFASLMFEEDGSLDVLDQALLRVTRIDAEGGLMSTTPLPGRASRLLPARGPDDDLVIMPGDGEHFQMEVSRDGERRDSTMLPPELRMEHRLIGESFTSRSAMGAVIAHRWFSRLVFLDERGGVRGMIEGIEPVDPPMVVSPIPGVIRVDPEATRAARDVSAAAGKVYVLFVGTTVSDARVVDVYDEAAMSYVGSYRVPENVLDIAVLADGRLATLEHDPVPAVRIWSVEGAPDGARGDGR